MHAALMVALGLILLAMNHANVVSNHKYWVLAAGGGPIALFMGLGAFYDPRVLVATGPQSHLCPANLKILALVLVVAGAAVGFYLTSSFYPRLVQAQ